MNEEKVKELRAEAKAKGIKHWHNKKPENLIKELRNERELDQVPPSYNKPKPKKKGIEVVVSKQGKKFLDSVGFSFDWLPPFINQYGLDKMEYLDKFKAFRCYKDGQHIDWIDINKLSIKNGGRNLSVILNKHQPTSKNKDFPNRGIITNGDSL